MPVGNHYWGGRQVRHLASGIQYASPGPKFTANEIRGRDRLLLARGSDRKLDWVGRYHEGRGSQVIVPGFVRGLVQKISRSSHVLKSRYRFLFGPTQCDDR